MIEKSNRKRVVLYIVFACILFSIKGIDGWCKENKLNKTSQAGGGAEEKKKLENIKKEIEKEKKKTNVIKKKEKSILEEIDYLDKELDRNSNELIEIENKIREKEDDINKIKTEINDLKRFQIEKKRLIKERLISIYKEQRSGDLNLLFGSENYNNNIKKINYLKIINDKDNRFLNQYKDDLNTITEKENYVNRSREELLQYQKEISLRMEVYAKKKKDKDILLEKNSKYKRSNEVMIHDLEANASGIRDLIERYENKSDSSRNIGKGFEAEKGSLIWPNNGEIVSGFGKNKHPQFDTYIFRKGIEIKSIFGEKADAIFNGKVVYADWFKGYGQLIIIDHGEGYYSLYGYLSKILVKKGDNVRKGQLIGEIGDSGLSPGNRLYFEVRHKGDPLNPEVWLMKR